jgi:hypothetical protein
VNMIQWKVDPTGHFEDEGICVERIVEAMGLIPYFLANAADDECAKQTFNREYAHGGGWHEMGGFKMEEDGTIQYPEDPPHRPLAFCQFGKEEVRIYEYGWVSIRQPDGSYEVSRMD